MAKFEIVTTDTPPRDKEKTIRVKFGVSSDGRSILAYAVDEQGNAVERGNLFTLSAEGLCRHYMVSNQVGIALNEDGQIAVR